MKSLNEQEVARFIARRLATGRLREQILAELCEGFAMNWEEAEVLLLEYEIRHGARLSSERTLIMAIAGFLLSGALFLGVYVLATFIIGDSAREMAAVLVFFFGALLSPMVLFSYSRYESINKEKFRCPNCRALINRLGHQDPIFLPLYERSTYFTQKKLLGTSRTGEYGSREGWQIYRGFEVSQICRQCHHVRSKKIVEKKVADYRPGDYRNN